MACTDPPYTVAGAELFLSRAVSALAAGPGSHVFFSFGARRPEETLRVQRLIADLGLTVRSLVPGFNSYTGAGVLAGVSHLYHLRTTAQARPAIDRGLHRPAVHGRHAGRRHPALPLRRLRGRASRSAQAPAGARSPRLKADGCPDCGGTVLRPMALRRATAGRLGDDRAAPGPRPASRSGWPTEDDLDVIAGFEIDIARASFGDEAIEDPALHRKRVAGALGKPGEVTLVAVATGAPAVPVGWAWLSGRTNSLTGARYGNFRSLATADVPGRGQVGELLMQAVLQASDRAGFVHLTGKVHASNLGMRALYRKFGFEAAHLTMERRRAACRGARDDGGGHGSGRHGPPSVAPSSAWSGTSTTPC